MNETIRNILYLVAAVMFILGIKGMAHPRTAVRANLLGALGMLIAIVVTLIDHRMVGWIQIAVGLIVGSSVGAVLAIRVRMTGMPQMVALLNGFGGLASLLVGGATLHQELDALGSAATDGSARLAMSFMVAVVASGLIGAVTFSGSLVAFAKLQELIPGGAVTAAWIKAANVAFTVAAVGLAVLLLVDPSEAWAYWLVCGAALVIGVMLVVPIGGADMPVVISLLNSYSGIAAAATGFVISNVMLIIAGALVGASGIILTRIMCNAMNRSLTNVLFGVMAEAGKGPSADEVYGGRVRSASAEEVAMLFDGAQLAMLVPGYGMAVAQAQHAVRDLMKTLESRGCRVEFAIHPVAGRMPGHMNVLLAEADVPYDRLIEMDEANARMERADVCLVIGANDVVNPVARDDPKSPIAGMPIINADKARSVVIVKRSLSPGFAGIPNPLFAAPNAVMYYGDGEKAVRALIGAIKES